MTCSDTGAVFGSNWASVATVRNTQRHSCSIWLVWGRCSYIGRYCVTLVDVLAISARFRRLSLHSATQADTFYRVCSGSWNPTALNPSEGLCLEGFGPLSTSLEGFRRLGRLWTAWTVPTVSNGFYSLHWLGAVIETGTTAGGWLFPSRISVSPHTRASKRSGEADWSGTQLHNWSSSSA